MKQSNLLQQTGATAVINSMGGTSTANANVTKTFNSLANIPKHKRNKLIAEAKPMLGASRKCKEMWRAIRKADFRKEGILNETNIKLLFTTCAGQIQDLLRLQTPLEMLQVFDTGNDSQLNEDEQILIFSVIKAKMQILADECCKIYEYQLYKDLMKEVRALELEIVIYQNELRNAIQQGQMKEYVQIGNDLLRDFYRSWEGKFHQFEDESLEKIQSLEADHEQQMEILNRKLDRAVEAAKIKPHQSLREMQNNEKLVAVNERIEEAMNYRGELKKFEVKEAERVEELRQKSADNQRKKLLLNQKKEMSQLEAKLETSRHNMKIQMDKDLIVLQKQINLHVHDIERMQGFVTKLSQRKGDIRDEILRGKERSRRTMEQLKRGRASGADQQGEGADMKKSMAASNLVGTVSGTMNMPFVEGSPIDVMLFGEKKKKDIFASSLAATSSSDTNASQAQVIAGLKHLIKVLDITTFSVSTLAPDGTRLYTLKNAANQGGLGKLPVDAQMQTKIQLLLDQRKPPAEDLPSLCNLYDDNLESF